MPSFHHHLGCLLALVLIAAGPLGAATNALTLTVKPARGGEAEVQITVDGGRIKVAAGGAVILTGDTKDGQKRRYSGKAGAFVAEVKLGEVDGFKVRNAAGKLLWKVKTTDTKTKVSDNEENKGAFEMAVKGATVRVSKEERLLGTFEFGPALEAGGANVAKVKDANGQVVHLLEPASRSLAGGAMLMAEIPTELRYVIMAELHARSR